MEILKNYVGEVRLIAPPEEITEESIAGYVAECAGVVRDRAPKDAVKLLHRLMTEAYGGKPSRVLEYVPCKWDRDAVACESERLFEPFSQDFGFFHEDFYYTNARELLNLGWDLDIVMEQIDFSHYKTVQCVAPYFVYGQLSTHTQITSVSHSQRFAETDRGYWCPKEIYEFLERSLPEISPQDRWNDVVVYSSPSDLVSIMKNTYGIKRREVWARGADMLQYRPFTLGGYTNNPNAWRWFVDQRTKDNHVQQETRDFVSMISEAVYGG